MESSKEGEDTYVPSGRLDSGITRSRVWGSRAMPAVVFLGSRGGRDMAVVEFIIAQLTLNCNPRSHGFFFVTHLRTYLKKCDMRSSSQAQQALEKLHLVVLLSTIFKYQNGPHIL